MFLIFVWSSVCTDTLLKSLKFIQWYRYLLDIYQTYDASICRQILLGVEDPTDLKQTLNQTSWKRIKAN